MGEGKQQTIESLLVRFGAHPEQQRCTGRNPARRITSGGLANQRPVHRIWHKGQLSGQPLLRQPATDAFRLHEVESRLWIEPAPQHPPDEWQGFGRGVIALRNQHRPGPAHTGQQEIERRAGGDADDAIRPDPLKATTQPERRGQWRHSPCRRGLQHLDAVRCCEEAVMVPTRPQHQPHLMARLLQPAEPVEGDPFGTTESEVVNVQHQPGHRQRSTLCCSHISAPCRTAGASLFTSR